MHGPPTAGTPSRRGHRLGDGDRRAVRQAARSTHHTPSGNRSPAAVRRPRAASRVLPAPPGPARVTRRCCPSRSRAGAHLRRPADERGRRCGRSAAEPSSSHPAPPVGHPPPGGSARCPVRASGHRGRGSVPAPSRGPMPTSDSYRRQSTRLQPDPAIRTACALAVSPRNPRYFTPPRRRRRPRRVPHRIAHLEQPPRRHGSRAGLRRTSRKLHGLRRVPALPREHGHNFIRLWRWEQFRSQAAGGNYHLCMTPAAMAAHRAGKRQGRQAEVRPRSVRPGVLRPTARSRGGAGERGIYVGVMLFDGWALHLSPPPDEVEGHPFHAAQQRQRHRRDVDRRPSGAAARPAGRRRSQEAYIARSWTPCTTCLTCCTKSRTSPPAAAR